ncbi:MAG: hypothetical protein HYW26_03855 [Candidatus Aenigmarchaeota archaeon]|nr:hypothetical protein [Candidatus Aenigmarchaeota archaeon]
MEKNIGMFRVVSGINSKNGADGKINIYGLKPVVFLQKCRIIINGLKAVVLTAFHAIKKSWVTSGFDEVLTC